MGSYGIGIERAMAAIVERNHDDAGIVWPIPVAPFEVVITVIQPKHDESMTLAASVYDDLRAMEVDVVLDDRDSRAGVKFADAELVGIPVRLTIGPKGIEAGELELVGRASGAKSGVAPDAAVAAVQEMLASLSVSEP